MAHGLETRENDDARMFFVATEDRDVPWHGLGKRVEAALTAHEAMVAAGLEWAVHKRQAHFIDDAGNVMPVDNLFIHVRDEDLSVLGNSSEDYQVFQPSECFAFFDDIVDSGEAKYETAGSVRGGREVFMTATLEKCGVSLVGGVDEVRHYLGLVNTYDRSRALTVFSTDIRMVCKNTVDMALANTKTRFVIPHVGTLDKQVADARQALALTYKYVEAFDAMAERFINEEFRKADMERLASTVFPVTKDRSDPNREKQYALIGAFESSPSISEEWRYTKWGAYNAVTEYLDWLRPLRSSRKGEQEEREQMQAEKRLLESWFGRTAQTRNKAFAALAAN